MDRRASIILAIVVVVALVLFYVYHVRDSGATKPSPREGFTGGQCQQTMWRKQVMPPHTAIQNRVDMAIGNPEAKKLINDPKLMMAYVRGQSQATPEDIMTAERTAWLAASEGAAAGRFDVERMTNMADDTLQCHTSAPAMDYVSMVTDLITDPRLQENHGKWVQEMVPFNKTWIKIDDLEMENYLDFQGLQRPQAGVGVYNPMMLTEIDDSDLARNHRFNFQG